MPSMWTKLVGPVIEYFRRKPVLAQGLVFEFTVTVEKRGDTQLFVRMYDWNHENLPDNAVIQAMVDAFVTGLIKKGADREATMRYVEQRWRVNTRA